MKTRTIGVIVVAIIIALAGCSHIESYLDIASDKGVSRKYLQTLDQWTKKEVLYSQFETKATIIATYKGADFNRGYLDEYVRIYKLTDEEKKRREDLQAGFTAESTEFLLYAAIPNKEANDFDRSNSLWSIVLVDEQGSRFEPVEIRKIDKVTPLMETFFPYINKYYGTCYSLKFKSLVSSGEKTAAAPKTMKLLFASPLGNMELSWP